MMSETGGEGLIVLVLFVVVVISLRHLRFCGSGAATMSGRQQRHCRSAAEDAHAAYAGGSGKNKKARAGGGVDDNASATTAPAATQRFVLTRSCQLVLQVR